MMQLHMHFSPANGVPVRYLNLQSSWQPSQNSDVVAQRSIRFDNSPRF
jgi:hypothetical protein